MEKQTLNFNLGCDAANISVGDLRWYESRYGKLGKTAKRMCQFIALDPGWYRVKLTIESDVTSQVVRVQRRNDGQPGLVVGDACYMFSDSEHESDEPDPWNSFIDDTHNLQYGGAYWFSHCTEADGQYSVQLEIENDPDEGLSQQEY